MEQLGKRHDGKIQEVCPVCGMARSEWPAAGVTVNGTNYCCLGCAEGTGCTCPRPVRPAQKQTQKSA